MATFTLLTAFLLCSPCALLAQGNWDVGFAAGVSNYMGDIGDGAGTRGPSSGTYRNCVHVLLLGCSPDANWTRDGLWHLRFDLSQINISGNDKDTKNPARRARNLHFRNQMTEGSIRLERDLMQKPLVWARQRRAMLTIRGFVGLARVNHNPESRVDANNLVRDQLIESGITSDGQWHSLPELMTGGVDYSDELSITTIPFGLSAVITGQKRGGAADFYVGIEIGFRMTDTDYLDDVTGFYADPSEMSTLGAALSSQSNLVDLELAGPGAGSLTAHSYIGDEIPVIRGNPANDDAYGSFVITYGKVLERTEPKLQPQPQYLREQKTGRTLQEVYPHEVLIRRTILEFRRLN